MVAKHTGLQLWCCCCCYFPNSTEKDQVQKDPENQSDTDPAIEKTKQTEAGAALLGKILPRANVLEKRSRQRWCGCDQNYLSVETKREDTEKSFCWVEWQGSFQKSAIDYRCITDRCKPYVSWDSYLRCNIQWVTQIMITPLSCVSLDQAVQIIMNNDNNLDLRENLHR